MRHQLQWNAAKKLYWKINWFKDTEHWLFLSGAFLRLNTNTNYSHCFCGKTTFCNIAAVEHKEILEHLHYYGLILYTEYGSFFKIYILINYFSIPC